MKIVFKKQSEQQAMPTWIDIVGCVVTDKDEMGKAYLVWGSSSGKQVILRDITDFSKEVFISYEAYKLIDQSWKIHRDVTLTVGE